MTQYETEVWRNVATAIRAEIQEAQANALKQCDWNKNPHAQGYWAGQYSICRTIGDKAQELIGTAIREKSR